ncbi:MAG: tRNA lysidine(34) synthetase TilS [Paludisphaera borealis]|uniref:tRNA lysidine(34) synthetase TilS n=1 Tax=Paludisphaera borealis TaxID=1387353 RepID=UPI00283C45DE|nr:tRNA lysidine(34) synthetase TilS [Paludisphaera borealis]MDR3622476.1 tRNA lysidine(34) synthetase TilS [Paludisphaera borealis]
MPEDRAFDDTGRPAWLEPVRRRIAGWLESSAGADWVVAVSGGGDSVCLLRVLHRLAPELNLRLSVAHLDHGVRGEQARDDARFVEALAGSLGLPFDLGNWRPTRAGHFEVDARTARYAWLREIAEARGASVVAVGHSRDDQAETIMHRILRGSGPRGLAGIPPRRALGPAVALVRPLLDVTRREIRDELARLNQTCREDPSNDDVSHTRARIRHELLPRLAAEYNPQIVAALGRLGGLAAAERVALDSLIRPIEAAAVRSIDPDRIVLDRRALIAHSPFVIAEIVRRAWRAVGWPEMAMTAGRWQRIAERIKEGRPSVIHIGEGVALRVDADVILLERDREPAPPDSISPVVLEAPGAVEVPWAGGRLTAEIVNNASSYDETIDLDRVVFPLVVRPPAPGDLFAPLGMSGRRVPLRNLLRARRVPQSHRRAVPLLCDQSGILWVVPHRIADRVKTTERTTRRLGLRWERVD